MEENNKKIEEAQKKLVRTKVPFRTVWFLATI